PLLTRWHQEHRSDAFLSFLVPLVASLRPYVDQELRLREINDGLAGEMLNTREVLDDVLVQSWEQFSRRKQEMPIDLWLVQLADESMQRLGTQLADASLDDQAPDDAGDSRLRDED